MRGSELAGLVQPDRRTCGSASLVAARLLNDPAYAARLAPGLPQRFGTEVLAVHRRTCRAVDGAGRAQLPWPRALGTSPWSLVRALDEDAGVPGTAYAARLVLPRQRGRTFDALRSAVSARQTAVLYVGNRLSPRHIVLAVDVASAGVAIYDPARGRCYPIGRADFVHGRLDVAGWQVPWLVVLPRWGRPPAQRSPA